MELHNPTLAKCIGKCLAIPISRLISTSFINRMWRMLKAYIAYLHSRRFEKTPLCIRACLDNLLEFQSITL